MFEKIKEHLNENFTSPELLGESITTDFLLEDITEGQFPDVIDKAAPDEDRDIDGMESNVSVHELDYEDQIGGDEFSDLTIEDLDAEDGDDDTDVTDIDEIEEDEEEDEIADEVINEALDNILFNEDIENESELDSLLDEAISNAEKMKKLRAMKKDNDDLKEDGEETDIDDTSLEETFKSFMENDDVDLDDDDDDDLDDNDNDDDNDDILDESFSII